MEPAVDPGVASPDATLRRAVWTAVDQVLSSVTNLALGVLVARSVSPAGFGAFSVAFATYLVCLGLVRAVTGEPLIVRFSARGSDARRAAVGASTGTALVSGGLLAGLLAATALAATAPPLRDTLLALAAGLPGLLLQDLWRYTFVADGRPAKAAANDTVWVVAQLALFGLLLAYDDRTVAHFVLAWGAAGAIAAGFGMVQTRTVPQPLRSPGWLQHHLDLGARYAGEYGLTVGMNQFVLLLLGAITGLASVGAFRGAQILLSPVVTAFAAVSLVAIPEGVRRLRWGLRRMEIEAALLSGAEVAVVAIATGVLLLVPDSVGREILGSSWSGARSTLVPIAVAALAFAAGQGAFLGLRVLAAARPSLQARTVTAALVLLGAVPAIAVAGATGAAWLIAATTTAGAALTWWFLRIELRSRRATPLEPAP